MNLITFFRIVAGNWKWLFLFPLLLAVSTWYFTRHQEREYQTSSTIYTGIASGYSITDDGESRVDFFAVNNAFDNLLTTIKSRENLQEVGMRLLAQHLLLSEPNKNILADAGFEKLKDLFPEEERKQIVVVGSFEKTLENLYRIKDSTNVNIVKYILATPGSFYNPEAILGSMTASRKGSSDMIEVTFKASDPGVCVNALEFLIDAFTKRYQGIKGNETLNVVKYFQDQLQVAFSGLQNAENRLRDFGIDNKIINYYEQAKFVAESKEDLATDFYKEKMKYEAALTAINRIEEKMSKYTDVLKNNEELNRMRQELSRLNYQITNATVFNKNTEKLSEMQDEVDLLKMKIKERARDFYEFNNNIEWIPQQTLLTEWLDKMVELEESRGRLQVYEKRMKQYDGIYKEFAPLGSTLSKLEREVGINEKEYLSVLHGLNLAKLRQKNIEMSNNLKVVDTPFYPINPLPSKRGLLIAVSFVAGFILLLAFFIVGELTNKSLRTPERVEKLTGLPLLSALPDLGIQDKDIRMNEIKDSLLQRIINHMFVDLKKSSNKSGLYIITILSTKPAEGKSYLAQQLSEKLSLIKRNVLLLYPETSGKERLELMKSSPKIITREYKVMSNLVDADTINDLIEENSIPDTENFSFVIVELPSLNRYPIPSEIIEKSDISILVVHAMKSWTNSDRRIIKEFERVRPHGVKVLLNNVNPDMLEGIYGEIPKNRSWLRKRIKLLLGGEKY